jgi:hypothetical protein
VRAAWWLEKQDEVVTEVGAGYRLMTGVCMRGLRRFTTKPSGYLVETQDQDRRLGGRRRDPGAREASMETDTWRDRRACVRRTRTAVTMWPCDEEECYMTYLPLRGLYHNLSARGSLVIFLAQRDSYILTLRFLGKPSLETASHFLAP